MGPTARFLRLTVFIAVLALPVAAQEPASIGITRGGITTFLVEEGFDSPTFIEDYPPVDGETYTSAYVPPGINVDMYGPDGGLTYIEARFRATDDSNEQYWQGLLAIKILEMAFPDWQSREEWLERVLFSGRNETLVRNGREIQVARSGPSVYLIVSSDN